MDLSELKNITERLLTDNECLQKWGWGQLFVGMNGDGDDLETSRGDKGKKVLYSR